ncbi:prepilin peptidase [Candidatus Saccharibacteria bacterium]|nr:prepilin peptidase [Candidatus Saccharibacteria bacterium]
MVGGLSLLDLRSGSWEGIVAVIVFMILGAVMGSFCCCQAWRIRYKEEGKKDLGKRSVCLKCGRQLKWYENVPVVSWLVQRGKCRGCGKEIGAAEILSELAGIAIFGILGAVSVSGLGFCIVGNCAYSNRNFLAIGVLAVLLVALLILAIYDAKWGELPTRLLVVGIVLGIGIWAISFSTTWGWGEGMRELVLETLGAVGILGGIYYLLYFFSKENLVGGGDWMLGVAIGLVLQDWWLAIWVLFLSNLVGAIVMLPQRKKKIAFGPFLAGAFVVVLALKWVILGFKP